VLGIVQQKLKKFKTGKLVIYGNLVAKVKELAQKLGCYAYYYNVIGKASMLEDFIAGKQQVIIATSALGIGVNIANI
jgi:superfamily II DNA helicase RecQ